MGTITVTGRCMILTALNDICMVMTGIIDTAIVITSVSDMCMDMKYTKNIMEQKRNKMKQSSL